MDIEYLYDDPPMIEKIESDGEIALLVPVAVDHDEGYIYFVWVAFSPYEEGVLEYSFCIIRRNPTRDEEIPYWSGLETKDVFTCPKGREFIRMVIHALTNSLIEAVAPDRVYRCTFDIHPPDKALDKHHMISWLFRSKGYSVMTTDPWQGHRTWIMEKIDSGTNQA